MSKLVDIIEAATGESVPIPSLLRMVHVLAARTDTPVLADWVDNELGGYDGDSPVPDYRGPFQTKVLSDWSGPFGSQLQNAPLPPSAFPKGLRDAGAFDIEFRESVSELERLAQTERGVLSYFWGTDVIGTINSEMLNGRLTSLQQMAPMHGIVSAHKVVSVPLITSVLDQVRTRVLRLALDIEKVAPSAGEPGAAITNQQAVQSIVHNYILGDGNTVAIGSPGAIQVGNVAAGDLDGLLSALTELGMGADDVEALREAIEGDLEEDGDEPKAGVGARVTQFMGRMAVGGLTIAGQTGTQEGVKMAGGLIRSYLGLA